MAAARCIAQGGRRIAVVDDDRNMAVVLGYNLQAAGYSVLVIETGTDAIEALAGFEPDLVVLDWQLPGLSGIEVLRQLRSRLAGKSLPVIMLTGRTSHDDRGRALDTGADIFMSKPFAMADLMRHVDTLLADGAPPKSHQSSAHRHEAVAIMSTETATICPTGD